MSTAITPDVVNHPQASIRSAALDLNIRQKSFVDYYIEVKVGWKAAQLAGYSGDRMALSAIASENLKKPNIAAYYEERLAELQISSTEVLAEIAALARYDIVENPRGAVRAVDKLKALELAGKYHKLFDQPAEVASAPAIATEVVSLLVQLAERNRAAQMSAQVGVDGPMDGRPVNQPQLAGESSVGQVDGPSSSSSSQPIIDVNAATRSGEDEQP